MRFQIEVSEFVISPHASLETHLESSEALLTLEKRLETRETSLETFEKRLETPKQHLESLRTLLNRGFSFPAQ